MNDDALTANVTVTLTPQGEALVALVRLGYSFERAEQIVAQAPPPKAGELPQGRPARPCPGPRLIEVNVGHTPFVSVDVGGSDRLPDCDGDIEGPQIPAQLNYTGNESERL